MVRIVKSPEERRKDIVMAACRLFLHKGYENSTMRDVMKELQIAKGTIYHYFSSKEELLDGVIDYIVDESVKMQRKRLASLEGNALQRIEGFVKAISTGNDGHAGIVDDLHKPGNAGMHIRLAARHMSVQAPVLSEMIQIGCREGVFDTPVPLECAEFIISGVQFLTDTGIYPWTESQLTQRVAAFPSIIEAMLRAPKGSFDFLLRYVS